MRHIYLAFVKLYIRVIWFISYLNFFQINQKWTPWPFLWQVWEFWWLNVLQSMYWWVWRHFCFKTSNQRIEFLNRRLIRSCQTNKCDYSESHVSNFPYLCLLMLYVIKIEHRCWPYKLFLNSVYCFAVFSAFVAGLCKLEFYFFCKSTV